MGERGWIPSRWAAVVPGVATVTLAALCCPAGALGHAAYVDAEFSGTPDSQCAFPDENLPPDPGPDHGGPCTTIAQAAPFVEDGLAVYVDDSDTSYAPVVAQGLGPNIAIISLDFATDPGSPPPKPWVIEGGSGPAVTVPENHGATIDGFTLRGEPSAVRVDGRASISSNTFDDPDVATIDDILVAGPGPTSIFNNVFAGGETAIDLADASGPATLGRNTISGYETGVSVGNVAGAVTSASSVLTGNVTGLEATQDVTIQNTTFWDNTGADISTDADLTIDSSIVEQEIDATGSTCNIAFSRGPTTAPQLDPCDAFQTDEDPMFADPPNDLLLLQAGSPMIDAGNPASTNLFRDIQGQPRFLDGNGDGACPVEPDMGADEHMGVELDCTPPNPLPQPPAQPGDTTPPQTTIETGPAPKTKSTSASFTLVSTEPGSSFECSLDAAAFVPCASPHTVKVKKGKHLLEVRARDAAGNADPSPAEWSWTVKKKKKKKKKKRK